MKNIFSTVYSSNYNYISYIILNKFNLINDGNGLILLAPVGLSVRILGFKLY